MSRTILYYPQMSMYNKQTGKLIPSADGNINMLRNTINEWIKHFPEDKFYVLIPMAEEFYPYGIFERELKINAAPLYYEDYVVSARINRFNFPMNEFSSILNHLEIDILINDVIELTPNFKQMFNIQFNSQPKIISNVRHVDEGKKSDYILSITDGILKSDLVTILSESMLPKLKLQMIHGGIERHFKEELLKKIHVFEPSVSSIELNHYYFMTKVLDLNKVIITFPGRLSFGEERRTNWDKFMDAIKILRDKRQDFEVYFTDPNNNMSEGLKNSLVDWVHTIPKDRDKFLRLLLYTDVIVSLMDVEGFGGISIREGLLMNCLPIIPNVHEYKKMAPQGYAGFIDSPINVDDLENALEWAIISIKKNRSKFNFVEYGKQFTVEEQFKNLLPYIGVIRNG